MFSQQILPVSCLLRGGSSEAEVSLIPHRNFTNVINSDADAHMYFAHASLSKLKKRATAEEHVVGTRLSESAANEESAHVPEQQRQVKMENPEAELGMRIAFTGNATLVSIDFGVQLTTVPKTAIGRINEAMLAESTFFSHPCMWVDWLDSRWYETELGRQKARRGDYAMLISPNLTLSGYGVDEPLARHENPKIPHFVNPFHPPSFDPAVNPSAPFLRIRLWLSPGLRASFNTKTFLTYLGLTRMGRGEDLELKQSQAVWFENKNTESNLWTSVTGDEAPKKELTGVAFRLDIEKSSHVAEIRATRNFTVSSAAQESDAALVSELSDILAELTEETNISLGVLLDDGGKFKFRFPTNGRASMNYSLSSNLAERLRTSATTVTRSTLFLPPLQSTAAVSPPAESTPVAVTQSATAVTAEQTTEAEELASNVLEAQTNGLVYVCSPYGTTENFPSKVIAILSPNEGCYKILDAAFTSPFLAEGAFLRCLPAGKLDLSFYTQDTDGKFERFAPAENMRFQGSIVWRKKLADNAA